MERKRTEEQRLEACITTLTGRATSAMEVERSHLLANGALSAKPLEWQQVSQQSFLPFGALCSIWKQENSF